MNLFASLFFFCILATESSAQLILDALEEEKVLESSSILSILGASKGYVHVLNQDTFKSRRQELLMGFKVSETLPLSQLKLNSIKLILLQKDTYLPLKVLRSCPFIPTLGIEILSNERTIDKKGTIILISSMSCPKVFISHSHKQSLTEGIYRELTENGNRKLIQTFSDLKNNTKKIYEQDFNPSKSDKDTIKLTDQLLILSYLLRNKSYPIISLLKEQSFFTILDQIKISGGKLVTLDIAMKVRSSNEHEVIDEMFSKDQLDPLPELIKKKITKLNY